MKSLAEAEESCKIYLLALDRIATLGLTATVSIKLTQFDFNQKIDQSAFNITPN